MKTRHRATLVCGAAWLLAVWAVPVAAAAIDIRDLGAVGDGKTLCTAVIQRAIDRTAAGGGGTVLLPAGTWLSGTLRLKSNVRLELGPGCVLQGSPRLDDYPEHVPKIRSYTDNYATQSLLVGEGIEGVSICGRGTIDGNGAAFRSPGYKGRPYLLRLIGCRDVLVEGVTMRNSAMWTQHYLACQGLRIHGITVRSYVNRNNDGLDIDACRDVTVSDCIVDSGDDALCLKSTLDRACENVVITNCVLSSWCNALKMGTESHGGFRNIAVSNCCVKWPLQPDGGKPRYGLGGIVLEIVDGGRMEQVTISNVAIEGVRSPIFVRLGDRGRTFRAAAAKPAPGTLRGVLLTDITASGLSPTGCAVSGIPGHAIEDLVLRDIHCLFAGGGSRESASREVLEREGAYPESTMFGDLPAYAFYFRHIKGLRVTNLRAETIEPDLRHAVVCEDVEDFALDDVQAPLADGAAAMLRLTACRDGAVRNCRPKGERGTFLHLQGEKTAAISLIGNDLRAVGRDVEAGPDCPPQAVWRAGNADRAKP